MFGVTVPHATVGCGSEELLQLTSLGKGVVRSCISVNQCAGLATSCLREESRACEHTEYLTQRDARTLTFKMLCHGLWLLPCMVVAPTFTYNWYNTIWD